MTDFDKDRDPPLWDQRPPHPEWMRKRRLTIIEMAESIDPALAAGIRLARRRMFPELVTDNDDEIGKTLN